MGTADEPFSVLRICCLLPATGLIDEMQVPPNVTAYDTENLHTISGAHIGIDMCSQECGAQIVPLL